MPKSNRRSPFGRSGTVTVIEEPVARSYIRKAKIVFFITWTALALLAATVLASRWPAVIALIAGALLALVPAFLIAVTVAAWPVIRAVWWWLPELTVLAAVITGWQELAAHTPWWARLLIVAAIVGPAVCIKPLRWSISALAWCLISRHRVRVCFSEFIIANRTGSLPFILAAVPTTAGERLWVWLRPGLCLEDIMTSLEEIAAACWAASVLADQASASNAALIRIDIKRRDTLTGTVRSPLTAVLGGIVQSRRQDTGPLPAALDLPDITPDEVTAPPARNDGPAPWPQKDKHSKQPAIAPADTAGKEDISDWI